MEMRLPEPGDALAGVDMFAGLEPEARQRVIAAAVPAPTAKANCSSSRATPASR